MAAAAVNGRGGDTKAEFARIYEALKEELLRDSAFDYTESSHQWIDRAIDLKAKIDEETREAIKASAMTVSAIAQTNQELLSSKDEDKCMKLLIYGQQLLR